MDLRICLEPNYHGYSISGQSYEFYLHLAQLDNLDFTMSHNKSIHQQTKVWKRPTWVKTSIRAQWVGYYERHIQMELEVVGG